MAFQKIISDLLSALEQPFSIIFAMNLSGTVAYLLLSFFNLFAKTHLTAKCQYRIRKIILCFFLIPFPLLFEKLQKQDSITAIASQIRQQISSVFPIEFTVNQLLLIIWMIGVILFLFWQLYCYQKFYREQLKNLPFVESNDVKKMLQHSSQQLGLHKLPNLVVNSQIKSPMLTGIAKPIIHLNKAFIDSEYLQLMLLHELVHLKRRDLIIKFFLFIVQMLYWLNPIVLIYCKNTEDWCELSCDEAVSQLLCSKERKMYGFAILEAVSNRVVSSFSVPFANSSKNKNQLKRRLTMLLNIQKPNKKTVLLSAILMSVILAAGSATAVFASNIAADSERCILTISNQDGVITEENGVIYETREGILYTTTETSDVSVKMEVESDNDSQNSETLEKEIAISQREAAVYHDAN